MTARPAYLRDVLFPRAVADGAFGPDAAYETFAADDDGSAGQHFASDIVFGTVTVRRNGAAPRQERHRVVVKFKNADAQVSAAMNMHAKFHNESVFYARLLPELVRRAPDPDAAAALFPRFVYSNATADGRDGDGGEQVVVVANVKPDGYREPGGPQPFLDADHVLLAVRKLGALHGLSYAAKARADGGPGFLRALTADLSETQWFGGHWFKCPRFLSGIGRRGVNALLADPERGDGYRAGGRLDRLLSLLDGESATIADALRPVEPLAVLCHGDYCRNNLLFRYDAATGRPADVVIVDPAQARYASPAVDLSFFLYMNTTAADRAAHWDDFVAVYVAGATETSTAAAAPDAAAVSGEMRGRCVYGYAHCSFFLPAMVDTRPPDVQRLNTCSDDEFVETVNASGGPLADGLLASVVGHMVDRGYV